MVANVNGSTVNSNAAALTVAAAPTPPPPSGGGGGGGGGGGALDPALLAGLALLAWRRRAKRSR